MKSSKPSKGTGRGAARSFGQDLTSGPESPDWRPRKRRRLSPGGGGGGAWLGGPKTKSSEKFNRKEADQRSNVNGAPPKPEWATGTGTENMATGTSIFDPVLCELAYRWFCPPGGQVLDPFAGGSVRGIVASKLGRRYLGVDLRAEQVAANEEQARAICDEPLPVWLAGDSRNLVEMVGAVPQADLIFSCPPYGDLEVYSDDPLDLSTLDYPAFRQAHAEIIAQACSLLLPDRFACFVVGDFRDRAGMYRNFPAHTIDAFEAAGCRLYNDAILVTALGSLPIRVGRQFTTARKLGKTHQNVLVFCNGDPQVAAAAMGDCSFGEIGEAEPAT